MNEELIVSWPGWETVGLIGRGSFGAVYEIERNVLGDIEKAALKVISIPQNASDIDEMYSDGYDDESITSTFQSHLKSIVAEYSLMKKMSGCTNIVNCDDVRYVQHDDGIGWDIFIKMELLTPLTKALPTEIPEETVIKVAKDMCSALELCKEYNIIHRDIKPQNIFVSDRGDFKLGDFGIAKTVEKTMGGTKIGTYKYMAPEVYNNQPYGSGADIYSLGLVLYWLLNERRMPFMPPPPAKLKTGLDEEARHRRLSGEPLPPPAHGSDELKQIVLKACAYDPKDRFLSAAEMLEALNKLNGGASAVAPIGVVDIDQGDDLTVGPVFDGGEKQNDSKADEQKCNATVGPVFRKENAVENEDSGDAAPPNNPVNDPDVSQKRHFPETCPEPKPKKKQRSIVGLCTALIILCAAVILCWPKDGVLAKWSAIETEKSDRRKNDTTEEKEKLEEVSTFDNERQPNEDIELSISQEALYFEKVGYTYELTANISGVSWSTSAPEIVSVSDTGIVTALNGGYAKVYAEYNGIKKACTVTVDTMVPSEEEINEAKRQLGIVEDYEANNKTYSYGELQKFYDEYINAGNTIQDHTGTVIKKLEHAEIECYYGGGYYQLKCYYYDENENLIYRDSFFAIIDGSFDDSEPTYTTVVAHSGHRNVFTVWTSNDMYFCYLEDGIISEFYGKEYFDGIASRTIAVYAT